jgi:hypothetical protein
MKREEEGFEEWRDEEVYARGGGREDAGECSRRVERKRYTVQGEGEQRENVVEEWREGGMHCRGRGREDYAEEGWREGDAMEEYREEG